MAKPILMNRWVSSKLEAERAHSQTPAYFNGAPLNPDLSYVIIEAVEKTASRKIAKE